MFHYTLSKGCILLMERPVDDLDEIGVIVLVPDTTVDVRLTALSPPIHCCVNGGVEAAVIAKI